MSAEEIDLRLAVEMTPSGQSSATASKMPDPAIYLAPNSVLKTPSWSHWCATERKAGKPRPQPADGFTQLAHVKLPEGEYRFRGVYHHGVPNGWRPPKGASWRPRPEDIDLKTSAVVLQVAQ